MRKYILIIIILIISSFNIYSEDTTSINLLSRWITGLQSETVIQGYTVENISEEEIGISFDITGETTKFGISIINPIDYNNFKKTIEFAQTNIFKAEQTSNLGSIIVNEADIGFGFGTEVMITPKINTFIVILNPRTRLDIVPRIVNNPIFRYNYQTNRTLFEVRLNEITVDKGKGEQFVNWDSYLSAIFNWFNDGIAQDSKPVRDVIVSCKILELREIQEEKDLMTPVLAKSRYLIGGVFDLVTPNIFSSRDEGLVFNSFSDLKFNTQLYFHIKELGADNWYYKPINLFFFFGGFFESDIAGAVAGKPPEEYLSGGLSAGVNLSFYIPYLVAGEMKKEIFGIGTEMQFFLNLNRNIDWTYAFEGNIVVHLFPTNIVSPQFFLGLNFSYFVREEQSGNQWTSHIYSMGINLGVRMRIEFYNFYETLLVQQTGESGQTAGQETNTTTE